jgi:hypothetical protein
VSRLSRQCGILNISQPYRPPRPVTAIALRIPFIMGRYQMNTNNPAQENSPLPTQKKTNRDSSKAVQKILITFQSWEKNVEPSSALKENVSLLENGLNGWTDFIWILFLNVCATQIFARSIWIFWLLSPSQGAQVQHCNFLENGPNKHDYISKISGDRRLK